MCGGSITNASALAAAVELPSAWEINYSVAPVSYKINLGAKAAAAAGGSAVHCTPEASAPGPATRSASEDSDSDHSAAGTRHAGHSAVHSGASIATAVTAVPPAGDVCVCGPSAPGGGCLGGGCGLAADAAPAVANACCGGEGSGCLCAVAARDGLPLTSCLLQSALPAAAPAPAAGWAAPRAAPPARQASLSEVDIFNLKPEDLDSMLWSGAGAPGMPSLLQQQQAAAAQAAQRAGLYATGYTMAPPVGHLPQAWQQGLPQQVQGINTIAAGRPVGMLPAYVAAPAPAAAKPKVASKPASPVIEAKAAAPVAKVAAAGKRKAPVKPEESADEGSDSEDDGSDEEKDEDGASGDAPKAKKGSANFSERVRKRRRESARRSRQRKSAYVKGLEAENGALKEEVAQLRAALSMAEESMQMAAASNAMAAAPTQLSAGFELGLGGMVMPADSYNVGNMALNFGADRFGLGMF